MDLRFAKQSDAKTASAYGSHGLLAHSLNTAVTAYSQVFGAQPRGVRPFASRTEICSDDKTGHARSTSSLTVD
jgi:hypothetical protein